MLRGLRCEGLLGKWCVIRRLVVPRLLGRKIGIVRAEVVHGFVAPRFLLEDQVVICETGVCGQCCNDGSVSGRVGELDPMSPRLRH